MYSTFFWKTVASYKKSYFSKKAFRKKHFASLNGGFVTVRMECRMLVARIEELLNIILLL